MVSLLRLGGSSISCDELCFRADDEECFLSNFYLYDIWNKARVYKTAEHLFQITKCAERSDCKKVRNAETPKLAKIFGRFVKVKPDWEAKKVEFMTKILRNKFRKQSRLRKLLDETGDVRLVQINYWHDTFWGICVCSMHKRTGENVFGNLLMMIRDEKDEEK